MIDIMQSGNPPHFLKKKKNTDIDGGSRRLTLAARRLTLAGCRSPVANLPVQSSRTATNKFELAHITKNVYPGDQLQLNPTRSIMDKKGISEIDGFQFTPMYVTQKNSFKQL